MVDIRTVRTAVERRAPPPPASRTQRSSKGPCTKSPRASHNALSTLLIILFTKDNLLLNSSSFVHFVAPLSLKQHGTVPFSLSLSPLYAAHSLTPSRPAAEDTHTPFVFCSLLIIPVGSSDRRCNRLGYHEEAPWVRMNAVDGVWARRHLSSVGA